MKTDVAIVGAGPGGTASALFLAQAGIRSVIIEKEAFPRFHIGESLTGEAGNLLRKLGLEQHMVERRHPVKYGVTVYGPNGKNSFWVPVMARSPEGELVKATTWQVRRSHFDKMLLDEAVAQDSMTEIVYGEAVKPLIEDDGAMHGVQFRTPGGHIDQIEADVVIDASGMHTFLCQAGVTSPKERGKYNNQIAIFSHVAGAVRDPGLDRDNTIILYRSKNHWAWFIPLDDEVVSVGVVVPSEYFAEQKESKHDFYLREIHELNPQLAERVVDAQLVEEVRAISNYSYHIQEFTGKGYLCVGDAHRFIDPIFSFGVNFALHEAKKAAEAISAYMDGKGRDGANPFADYQDYCQQGMDVIQDALDAFWDHPLAFAFFVHSRYPEDMIDLFAGRVYTGQPSRGLMALRTINATGVEKNVFSA